MPINPHNPFRAGPFGEVLAVVDTTGALTQYDSAGAHLLFGSGVQSVGLAFGPFGEVLEVVGATGTLTQYDSAGAHLLFGSGVESAGVARSAAKFPGDTGPRRRREEGRGARSIEQGQSGRTGVGRGFTIYRGHDSH